MRRAEAHCVDFAGLLPRVVAARRFKDVRDVAAVLRDRVVSVVSRNAGAGRSRLVPRLVAGLTPRAIELMDASMRSALDDRTVLIESRANAVPDHGLLAVEP